MHFILEVCWDLVVRQLDQPHQIAILFTLFGVYFAHRFYYRRSYVTVATQTDRRYRRVRAVAIQTNPAISRNGWGVAYANPTTPGLINHPQYNHDIYGQYLIYERDFRGDN